MELIQYLLEAPVFDRPTSSIIIKTSVLATTLAVIYALINVGWNYAVTAVKRLKDQTASFFVDIEEMIRIGVIIGCIFLYMPLLYTVYNFSRLATAQINPDDIIYENAELMMHRLSDKVSNNTVLSLYNLANDKNEEQDPEKYKLIAQAQERLTKLGIDYNSYESLTKYTEKNEGVKDESAGWNALLTLLNPKNWVKIATSQLAAIASLSVRVIMLIFIKTYLKVLFCLGPFAFAFSILPGKKNQISVWANATLHAMFCFLTINILDALVLGTTTNMEVAGQNPEGFIAGIWDTFTFNIVIVIMYLQVFKLTAKYVGQNDVGGTIGKAVGLAAAAAGLAMVGGAASGAGGAGQSFGGGNSLKTATDAAGQAFGEHGKD